MKNILKYLRRTKDIFQIYRGSDLKLDAYSDSSFQSDPDDSKSTSGYIFILYRGTVSWKSTKQPAIADSVTKAEYIATGEATKEAVWMKKFIMELDMVPNIQ